MRDFVLTAAVVIVASFVSFKTGENSAERRIRLEMTLTTQKTMDVTRQASNRLSEVSVAIDQQDEKHNQILKEIEDDQGSTDQCHVDSEWLRPLDKIKP